MALPSDAAETIPSPQPSAGRLQAMLPAIYVGAIALFMRAYYVYAARVDTPLRADARQYFRIAMNMLDFGVFSASEPSGAGAPPADSYRGPGYPLLVAVALLASGRNVEVAYYLLLSLQAILGAAVAVLMYETAKKWMPAPAAFATGILVAVWPHLISQGDYILTESVFGFSLVLGAYFLSLALSGGRVLHYVLAGVAFAYAALVNQVILILPLILVALSWSRDRRPALLLYLALALLPSVLWSVRCAQVEAPEGRAASSRLFENILIGMEPNFAVRFKDPKNADGAAAAKWVGDVEHLFNQDRPAAYAKVLERLGNEPRRQFFWFVQKPALLWEWNVGQGAGDIYIYPMVYSPFVGNPVFVLVAAVCRGLNVLLATAAFLMLIAMFVSRNARGVGGLLCATVFCYAVAVHTALTPDARYANPFRPFEIAMGVGFAALLAEKAKSRLAAGRSPTAMTGDGR